MITSQSSTDQQALSLTASDFLSGGLRIDSHIRPQYLFAACEAMIQRQVRRLKPEAMDAVLQRLRLLLD
jgi:hypothetical protein